MNEEQLSADPVRVVADVLEDQIAFRYRVDALRLARRIVAALAHINRSI